MGGIGGATGLWRVQLKNKHKLSFQVHLKSQNNGEGPRVRAWEWWEGDGERSGRTGKMKKEKSLSYSFYSPRNEMGPRRAKSFAEK